MEILVQSIKTLLQEMVILLITLAIALVGNLGITANDFINTGSISVDTFNLSVKGDFDYANDFINNGDIDANHQNFIIRNGDFTNNTTIALAGNLGITANNFINTGGSITADTLSLSVAGDFDYNDIDATNLNIKVGGDFSYNNISKNFVLDASDNLVVLGNVFITANNFSNTGNIHSNNVLDISVVNDFSNSSSGDINASSYNIKVGNNFYFHTRSDFDFLGNLTAKNITTTADNFTNSGNINASNFNLVTNNFYNQNNAQIEIENNLNITANNNFRNNGTINSKKIDIQTKNFINGGYLQDQFFIEQAGGSISGIDLAIKTEDSFYNNKNIMAVHSLNIAASNDFYNYSDGNISAPELAIDNRGFYFNSGIITKGDDALPEIQPIPIIEKITEEKLKDIQEEEEEKEKREIELRQIEKEKKEKNRRIKELKRKKEKSKKIKNKKKRKIKKKIDREKGKIRKQAEREERKLQKEREEILNLVNKVERRLNLIISIGKNIKDLDQDIERTKSSLKDLKNPVGVILYPRKRDRSIAKLEERLSRYKNKKIDKEHEIKSIIYSTVREIKGSLTAGGLKNFTESLKELLGDKKKEITEIEDRERKITEEKEASLRDKDKKEQEELNSIDKETENEEKEITKEIAEKEKELIDAQKKLDEIEIANIPSPYGSDIKPIGEIMTNKERKIAETRIEKKADKVIKNKDFEIHNSALFVFDNYTTDKQKIEIKEFIKGELEKWKNSPNYQKKLENNYKKLIFESYFTGVINERRENHNAVLQLGNYYLAHNIKLNLEKAKKDCKTEKRNDNSIACQAEKLFREYNERYPNSATAKILTDTEEGIHTAKSKKNILKKYSKYNKSQFKEAYTKCKGYLVNIGVPFGETIYTSVRQPLKDLTSSYQCNEFRELHIEQRKKWNEDSINYANQLIKTIKNKNSSATQEDIISEMRYKGFQLIPQEKNAFHCPQLGCKKLLSLDGKLEIILDKHGEVVTNSESRGTYNYFGLTDYNSSQLISKANHTDIDITPYIDFGNDENDTTTRGNRRLTQGLEFIDLVHDSYVPDNKEEAVAKITGAAIGGAVSVPLCVLGSTLGSAAPIVGTAGGCWLGSQVGKGIGFTTGIVLTRYVKDKEEKKRINEKVNQLLSEI